MIEEFQARGLHAKTLHVQGRYILQFICLPWRKIIKFSIPLSEMRFPTVEKVLVPLRSTLSGEVITTGSLYRLALESMLLKPASGTEL
jgi:hypothetical protein